MDNRFEDAAPFGQVTDNEIHSFENRIGFNLPFDYKRYLLSHNGAEPKDSVYKFSSGDQVNLHHWFGLHSGPDCTSLEKNWQLSEWYDLQKWKKKLSMFLVFADTGLGDPFAIDLQDGSIWHYEHDAVSWVGMPGKFYKVENSFYAFVDSLCSEVVADEQMVGTPAYDAYLRIMADIKQKQKDQ